MSIGKSIDNVADVLLALIAKHGDTARVINAIREEQRDGKE